MAAAVLELLLSNLIVAAALAVVALAAGKWGRRPALTHALWLLVLLKLITPPVVDVPVRLLPPAPEARQTFAAVAPGSPEAPSLPPVAAPQFQAVELTPDEPASPRPVAVKPPRKLEEFRVLPPVTVVTTGKVELPSEPPPMTPPADIPQFVVEPPAQVQLPTPNTASPSTQYTVPSTQSGTGLGTQSEMGSGTQSGMGSSSQPGAGPSTQSGTGSSSQSGMGPNTPSGIGSIAQSGAGPSAYAGTGSIAQSGTAGESQALNAQPPGTPDSVLGTQYSVLPSPHSEPFPWAAVALAVWFGGALAWLALVGLRVRRFARLLRLADDAPAWFVREVADTANALGLARSPRVKLIPGAVAPMVWSLGRTAVYFPAELLTRLSATQRASLIAHELAHLRRGDHWVRWLELFVVAAYWWCPLAWFARRELQRAEEECCDAWVVASLPTAGRTYASALLDTLDFLAEAPVAPALASGMGTAATVKRRLLLILDGKTPNRLPRLGRVFVFLLALVLLPVAPKLARLAASPSADEPAAPTGSSAQDRALPTVGSPNAATLPALPGVQPPPVSNPAVLNPRGEPLLFEGNGADLRPRGPTMWAVAASPDGKIFATAHGEYGSRGEVRIWDRVTGKVIRTIPFEKGVRSVAFSPDGKVLATGCFDGAVRLYDPATFGLWAIGNESTGGHRNNGVNGICIFKNGKYLATAGFDNTIRVWDIAAVVAKPRAADPVRMAPVAIFEGHTQRVLSVAVSEDGRTLLSGSADVTARVWDIPDPLPAMGEKPIVVKKERRMLPGHASGVEAIAVSPDGQLLVTGDWAGQLQVRDQDGRQTLITSQFQTGVICAAFSSDGKYLAVGGGFRDNARFKEVRVWEVATRREVAYRADFEDAINGLEFSPDGKTLFLAGSDQAIHVWPWAQPADQQTLKPLGMQFTPQPFHAVAISPDNRLLALAGESRSVFIWDRREGKIIAELTGHADVVTGLAFSPDGKTLATASHDKTTKLWDTATWKPRHTLTGHTGWVLAVAFSPDGTTVVTGSYDKTVRLWNVDTGTPKTVLKDHTAGVRAVVFDPSGKFLVSAGSDRTIRVWDMVAGTVVHQLKGHKAAVRTLAISPDSKLIASGSEDRTVKLWELATGKELNTFTSLPDMVTAVRFSPKGQTLAVTTFNGALTILDPITGRRRQSLYGHGDVVTGAVFTDDCKFILTVSHDRRVRQWPAVPPSNVAAGQGPKDAPRLVAAVGIDPVGSVVVLGGTDGSVSTWDLRSGEATTCEPFARPGGVAYIAVSAESRVVVIGKDQSLVVGTLRGEVLWKGKGRHAEFSPEGRMLAVVEGRDIILRDAATGAEIRKLEAGHDGLVACVAYSSDGRRLASVGDDGKVRLWDPATGEKKQLTNSLLGYASFPGLAFNAEGTKLAVVANSAESPPPDDMTGQFRPLRTVFVLDIPANDNNTWNVDINRFLQHPFEYELTAAAWAGRGLVTTSADGLVRVWDTDGRRIVQTFRAHEAAILASAVAPESGAFVTTGEDMAVKRWKLPGLGQAPGIARLTPPGQGRTWVAEPSRNGKYFVAGGGGDKMFRVYSALPVAIPTEPDRHPAIFGLAFSPDGKFLVTGHERGVLVVREAATGKPLRILEGHAKRISSVAFAEGGSALVTVGGNWFDGNEAGEAIVWDFPSGTIRHKLEAPVLQWMVAIHPNGKLAAGAGNDGKVRVWDLTSGKIATTLTTDGAGLYAVAFDRDGRRIVGGSSDKIVRIWDVDTRAVTREIKLNPNVRPSQTLFSPDGREVVVAAWWGGGPNQSPPSLSAYLIDSPDVPPRQLPTHAVSVMGLAFLADGKTLVAAGGETSGGSLRVYDFASGKLLGQFAGHRNWAQNLAVSADGKVASTSWATGATGELRLWNAAGFRPLTTVAVPSERDYIAAGAISPDSKLLVIGGWSKTLNVFDMTDPAKPRLKKDLGAQPGGLRSIAFSADGERFVTSDEAGFVRVWDAVTLEIVSEFKASEQAVYRAKFTPDGKQIVTVAGNWQQRTRGEIRVWNPVTGKEDGRFPDQSREVWDLEFLDGGKLMITTQAIAGGPDDVHLKVWDFATKREVRRPLPNNATSTIRSLAVSPDGKLLALGSSVGPVKVLDMTTWQEVLSVPDLKDVCIHVAFTPNGKTLMVASGDNATILIAIPESK